MPVKAPLENRTHLIQVMNDHVVKLDVREHLQSGREPFSIIMQAVANLRADQSLLLVVSFEPVPLYGVLGNRGFAHQATAREDGVWEVLFSRPSTSPAPLELDVRGLEPPQPLVVILEALDSIPEDGELLARTDRRPMHLYSQLEERGFTSETIEEADGTFATRIRRS